MTPLKTENIPQMIATDFHEMREPKVFVAKIKIKDKVSASSFFIFDENLQSVEFCLIFMDKCRIIIATKTK